MTDSTLTRAGVLSETTDARYQVVKILGQGGSADVYLARHVALGEMRVLKVLHQDMMMDPKRRSKFFLEAQLATHLKHPAIVHIYDVNQSGSKLQIEMEYIDGWSLRQLLEQKGTFPQPVALALMVGILEGLAHAHAATLDIGGAVYDGVIHRDLKPENILIRKSGQPVICDFGVAKLGADLLSMTQNISGSVAYMAPERLRGEVSTRSIDIFAMGVMLFELLTGKRPFPSRNQGEAIESLLHWKLVDLEQELQGTDSALIDVIRKAMARDTSMRYADAGQMLQALRPIYRLYHGEATPTQVMHAFLTTGQFTTSEFKAILAEPESHHSRWLWVGGITLVAILVLWLYLYRQGFDLPRPQGIVTTQSGKVTTQTEDWRAAVQAGDYETALLIVSNLTSPLDRQDGYFTLAQAFHDRAHDAGNALLMAQKALDLGFHPTIAALRARIGLDQDMPKLAQEDLQSIEPWLEKLTPENKAQVFWLQARLEMYWLDTKASQSSKLKARSALQNYLRTDPRNTLGHQEDAKAMMEKLGPYR